MTRPARSTPLHVVVMGVAGTGKSTIGQHLAEDLGIGLLEGDSFHPAANIAKMSTGVPLDDDDRLPWLMRLAEVTADRRAEGSSTVLACSALRRRYRDLLRGDIPPQDTFFVHLHATYEVLVARMARRDHFMPTSLLQSQLDTLEPLEDDEEGVLVDVALPVDEVLRRVRSALPTTVSA